jgi:hypothetical protein
MTLNTITYLNKIHQNHRRDTGNVPALTEENTSIPVSPLFNTGKCCGALSFYAALAPERKNDPFGHLKNYFGLLYGTRS